jgi:actin-related protein
MEKLLRHTFDNELKIAPEEVSLVQTECLATTDADRHKMGELVFETFGCRGLYQANSALLSLYSSGRTTGLVVDSGDGHTDIVPIYDSEILSSAFSYSNLGGSDLTCYLMKMLSFGSNAQLEVAQNIKETLCYVPLDFEQEMCTAATSSRLQKGYKMPNGRFITIGNERFRCSEALFNPRDLLGMQFGGIHESTYDAIMKCAKNIQKELYDNIVLSGGNTMFPGVADRLVRVGLHCPFKHEDQGNCSSRAQVLNLDWRFYYRFAVNFPANS